jgi:hypothetical protein
MSEVFDQVSLFLTRFHAEVALIGLFTQVKLTDGQLKEIKSAVEFEVLKSRDVFSQGEQTETSLCS